MGRGGARRTLGELKALGLKTFLMPLSPGKDLEKRPIDYASSAMDGVWEAIEEEQVPVSHHIGESPPATPNEHNAVSIGMFQSVAPFRDTFAKYVFGGILDRHPGLRIGWFEGGINWVPSALQDADHIAASFRHLSNLKIEHEPTYYWDTHMCASFMVDPLGLALLPRIGVDRVMWSTDFPHNESTYGYSNQSLAEVVDAVGAEGGHGHRQRQHQALPRVGHLMPAGLMASVTPTLIPATPDLARMRRERMGRVHAAMREQGLDALVLLGNTNVVYATGAIWPLADSGRANFEQPVALVLADDEWPHLFSPMREDDRLSRSCPRIISTARSTSTSTKECSSSRHSWRSSCPPTPPSRWTNGRMHSAANGRSSSPTSRPSTAVV